MFGLDNNYPTKLALKRFTRIIGEKKLKNRAVVSFKNVCVVLHSPEKMLKGFYCYITEGASIMPDS